ncbi:MAG: hypothetical protein IKR73_06145 [Oscillospiraceae bacterium]|nr:hypothetical protein [Oscillospiraceae bacterium]
MQVAMALGVLVVIIIIIGMIIGLLIGGIVLTIFTSRRHKKRTAQGLGSDAVQVIMTIGCVMLYILPVGTALALLLSRGKLAIDRMQYQVFTDKWRHEIVFDTMAQQESLDGMLALAEASDADAIYKAFSSDKQNDSLRSDIDKFLTEYPKGLSECEWSRPRGGSGGNNSDAHFTASSSAIKDGRYWYIYISGCNMNDDPAKVGLDKFIIYSQEVCALDRDFDGYGGKAIVCAVTPSRQVDVVIINGNAYERGRTGPPIPYDEVLSAIKDMSSLDEFKERFGEPDVDIPPDGSPYDAHRLYWSVEPDGDQPRFIRVGYNARSGDLDKSYTSICGRDEDYHEIWFTDEGNIRES